MKGMILYFDICAVPVYLIIIVTTLFRGMTKGRSNRLYLAVASLSFAADLCELVEQFAFYGYTLNMGFVVWVKMSEYLYFITRNAVNVAYLFFVISMTKTWYKIKPFWKKLLLLLPYLVVISMLAMNEATGCVFTVNDEDGYVRGSLILLVYAMAACYLLVGTTYLVLHRYTLDRGAWYSLMAMYFINVGSVMFQLVYPHYLIESFATSLTVLFVVLFVQRPELQVDMSSGLPAYRAFCNEMGKIKVTGHDTQIVIVNIRNAAEMRSYLKEAYYAYLHVIDGEIRVFARREKVPYELYFEEPGTFYIILDDEKYNPVQAVPELRDCVRKNSNEIFELGATPNTRVVTVTFPKEIDSLDELLRFGHNFSRFADYSRVFSRATDITSKRSYQIEAHLDEILNRAMTSGGLSVRYQPIRSVSEGRFVSAEAVIALSDEVYGDIDSELLITAAEERGLSVRLGSRVLEEVFGFAGSETFRRTGLSQIYVGLSVTQCMRMELTDIIWNLRERSMTAPQHIAFIIRESSYENMSRVFNENLKKLSAQGYTLVLDGFGHGYSNVQRLLDMPVRAARLDKNIVRSAGSGGGRAILRGMIEMVKDIPLEVMAQGADDEDTANMLSEMDCGLIQGQFYSGPLTKDELEEITVGHRHND